MKKPYPLRKQLLICILYLFCTTTYATSKEFTHITAVNSTALPPFSYTNEQGEPRGLLYDLWKEATRKQGINVNFENLSWTETLKRLKNDTTSVHTGIFISNKREEYLDYSQPLGIRVPTTLFVSNTLPVTKISDLGNIAIGVTKDSFVENFIRANYPNSIIRTYPSIKESIEAAIRGEIRAFVCLYPSAMYYLNKYDKATRFQAVETLTEKELYMAVTKGNSQLLAFVNKTLNELPKKDFERIVNKWIKSNHNVPNWVYLTISATFLILVISFALLYIFLLKKQVISRTKDLQRLADIDVLTQCYNRQKIDESINQEIFRCQKSGDTFSIILLDVDNFKHINDSFGHTVGDQVLIEVATLLKTNTRACDMVGRWGGEEFVIICPNATQKIALREAKNLREILAEHKYQSVPQCTASFGVTQLTTRDKAENIFIRADKALYRSKEKGRNRVTLA